MRFLRSIAVGILWALALFAMRVAETKFLGWHISIDYGDIAIAGGFGYWVGSKR